MTRRPEDGPGGVITGLFATLALAVLILFLLLHYD